jgi:hypothetical protein
VRPAEHRPVASRSAASPPATAYRARVEPTRRRAQRRGYAPERLAPVAYRWPVTETQDPRFRTLEDERQGWYEVIDLVRSLTVEECLVTGYYRDPDWSVRDLLGHLGTWLAEAQVQLERMVVGRYEGHDVDIDGLNASFLAAMRDEPFEVTWLQANAGRTRMLQARMDLGHADDEEAWWIRKSGAEHYGELLPRLREWVADLVARRPTEAG